MPGEDKQPTKSGGGSADDDDRKPPPVEANLNEGSDSRAPLPTPPAPSSIPSGAKPATDPLSRLEQDISTKNSNRSDMPVTKPGAVHSDNTDPLEKEILAKQQLPGDRARNDPLSRLEDDLLIKRSAKAAAPAVTPGAVPASPLDNLEHDLMRKQEGTSSVNDSVLRSDLAAQAAQNLLVARSGLNQLEEDMEAKRRAVSGVATPSNNNMSAEGMAAQAAQNMRNAQSGLTQFEDDLDAKRRAAGSGVSPLTQMEDSLRSKMVHGVASARSSATSVAGSSAAIRQLDDPASSQQFSASVREGSGSFVSDSQHRGPPATDYFMEPPVLDAHTSPLDLPESSGGAGTGSSGIEAFVANNVVQATGVAVIMSDEEEEKIASARRKKFLIAGGILLIILVIAVVVPVALFAGEDETTVIVPPPTPQASLAPSGVPSLSPTTDLLQTVIECLKTTEISAPEQFNDRTSAQYLAAEWLAVDDMYWQDQNLECTSSQFQQRFALAVYYFTMDGDEWSICGRDNPQCTSESDDFGFLSNTNHCSWYRIICNDQGLVVSLDFSGASTPEDRLLTPMAGTLPMELQYLSSMERLGLFDFELTGSIIGPLRTWSGVQSLILGSNNLSGVIPDTISTDWPLLTDLRLNGNSFTGQIPDGIADLSSITDLRLAENNFDSTLPARFGENFGQLGNLIFNEAGIRGPIPAAVWTLPSLRILELMSNPDITGSIPASVGQMVSLRQLRVTGTRLGGPLPAGFYTIPLAFFDAHSCNFTGPLSPDVLNWNATLREFDVTNNELTGPIPSTEFAQCEILEELRLRGNALTGTITDDLCEDRNCLGFGCLNQLRVDCNVACNCCDFNAECPENTPT